MKKEGLNGPLENLNIPAEPSGIIVIPLFVMLNVTSNPCVSSVIVTGLVGAKTPYKRSDVSQVA